MVTKKTGMFSIFSFLTMAGIAIYIFLKAKESYYILSKKCTELKSKINDLETDIDLLYEQIESHRSVIEATAEQKTDIQ